MAESLMFASLAFDLILMGGLSACGLVVQDLRTRGFTEERELTAIGLERVRMTKEEILRVSDMVEGGN